MEFQNVPAIVTGGASGLGEGAARALAAAGHRVEVETAERVLKAGIAAGHTAEDLRADPIQWQQDLLYQDYDLFENLPVDEPVFTDTSFLETLVFGARAGIAVGPNIESWLRLKRYERIFFLDRLESYEQTAVRMESTDLAGQIVDQVRAIYPHHGYEILVVPALPVAERVAWIQSFLDDD